MEIQFYGANCISLSTKQARIVVDDNIKNLRGNEVLKSGDIALFTGSHSVPKDSVRLLIDQPGEYEIAGISIYGIAAQSHLEKENDKSATMYKILIDDTSILIAGHIYPDLSDTQLEAIGMIDIMVVPVGGNGFTLDPVGALKLIKKIEPKVVIPTHYQSDKLHFEVPQQPLDQAIKALSMEPKETIKKYKPKAEDLTEGLTSLVILEES
ncbi:MAG TPA: MBL fold metallo-hydrolase [Candidatus Saccharimonadales bacterium]|nr:MBL fold metallo-hydrolase [Candidatus Saccharimonadales bacterium]